ncbi:MAG TPA: hypothetical protein DEF51_14310 [Myxococcales bacterium]|nr:hypothetical protein [Myxococcales bacterium]
MLVAHTEVALVTPGHAAPQPPQLDGSTRVSVQEPEQSVSGAPQLAVQAPIAQVSPAPQVTPTFAPLQSPLAPQNARLVSGSTQRPPQSI